MINPNLPPVNLNGLVALVTGGGRGIGKIIAQKLAASGAAVAITGRSTAHLDENVEIIRSAGGRAMAVGADVTDRAAVERVVQEVQSTLGSLDVLVNNAAVALPIGPFAEIDPEEWWRLMEINMLGPMLCTRAVLPDMIQRKRGVIINVVSGAGMVTIPHFTGYCASKAALIRFTDCLAMEVKEHNIAAFSVNPGAVLTDMTQYGFTDDGKKWASWVGDIFTEGRDVSPDVSANLITFLASGQANSLTGRYISVGHDVPEMLQRADEIQRDDLYMMRLRN